MTLSPDQFSCARLIAVILLLVCVLFSVSILAEEPQLQFTRISEFKNIVDIANAGDGSDRLTYSLPADSAEGDIAITRVIPAGSALCEVIAGAE